MPVMIDGRCNWVTVQPTNGVPRWQLQTVEYVADGDEVNNGSVNIYARAIDENGAPLHGIRIYQNTPDNENEGVQVTDTNGWVNHPMSGNSVFFPDRGEAGPYRIYVEGNTDVAHGFGLPVARHVQYYLTFQRVTGAVVEPPIEPPSESEFVTRAEFAAFLRNLAGYFNQVADNAE